MTSTSDTTEEAPEIEMAPAPSDAVDEEATAEVVGASPAGTSPAPSVDSTESPRRRAGRSPVTVATAVGLLIAIALAVLAGWLGLRAQQEHRLLQQRDLFLQTGRQAALNLTTISYTEVDTDIQRIIDSATGDFQDEFRQRSQDLAAVVNRTRSQTVGTVTEAGVESMSGDSAQVLVALAVKVSDSTGPNQPPRNWRMRIAIRLVDGSAKVSKVGFVA